MYDAIPAHMVAGWDLYGAALLAHGLYRNGKYRNYYGGP